MNELEITIQELKSQLTNEVLGRWPIQINPIPITEEWLVRFGFEHEETEYSNFQNKDGVRLFFHNGVWNYSSLNTVIKSVHQLQNLYFALTGEELTLNEEII
jgi:hypothetical protein